MRRWGRWVVLGGAGLVLWWGTVVLLRALSSALAGLSNGP